MITRYFIALCFLIAISASNAYAQDAEKRACMPADVHQCHLIELDLGPAQRERANEAHRVYVQQFDDLLAARKEFLHWLWCPQADIQYGPNEPVGRAHRRYQWQSEQRWHLLLRELERRYFDRIGEIALGQDEAVASLRRAWLRKRILRNDNGSFEPEGSRVDLISVLDSVDGGLRFDEQLQPLLLDYELRVHEVIDRLDLQLARASSARRPALDALRDLRNQDDKAAMEAASATVVDEFVRPLNTGYELRGLNRQCYDRIVQSLEPEMAQRFRNATHPLMFEFMQPDRWARIERRIEAALALKDLDDDQRQRLLVMRADFINKRDAAAIELDRLFDRTVTPQARRAFFQAWAQRFVSEQRDIEWPDNGQAALDEAMERWQTQVRATFIAFNAVVSERQAEAISAELDRRGQTEMEIENAANAERIYVQNFGSPLDSRLIHDWLAASDLDDLQKLRVSELYREYLAESAMLQRRVIDGINQADARRREWDEKHANGDDAWLDHSDDFGMADHWLASRRTRLQLERGFEAAVQSLIGAAHHQSWRSCVAACRRQAMLPQLREQNSLCGNADLVSILRELSLNDAERRNCSAAIVEYQETMDQTLQQLQEHGDALGHIMSSNARGRREDLTPAQEQLRIKNFTDANLKLNELHQAILNVNQRSIAAIAAALDGNAAAFHEAIDRNDWPDVFVPCPVELAIKGLRQDVALEPAPARAIEAILSDYLPVRDGLRRKVIDAIRRWNAPAEIAGREAERQRLRDEGIDWWTMQQDHFAVEHLGRRVAAARDGCARLKSLFSPHQFQQLPVNVQYLLDW